jgi:hypothetical protein
MNCKYIHTAGSRGPPGLGPLSQYLGDVGTVAAGRHLSTGHRQPSCAGGSPAHRATGSSVAEDQPDGSATASPSPAKPVRPLDWLSRITVDQSHSLLL